MRCEKNVTNKLGTALLLFSDIVYMTTTYVFVAAHDKLSVKRDCKCADAVAAKWARRHDVWWYRRLVEGGF